MIKMKIEIASNEELMRSGGRKRNKSIKLAEKKRERHRLACFSGGRRRTVKMVSSEWRRLRVTEESSKVLKVGQEVDLTMTAES